MFLSFQTSFLKKLLCITELQVFVHYLSAKEENIKAWNIIYIYI